MSKKAEQEAPMSRNFRILEKLDSGACADIFVGENTDDGKRVAIKLEKNEA